MSRGTSRRFLGREDLVSWSRKGRFLIPRGDRIDNALLRQNSGAGIKYYKNVLVGRVVVVVGRLEAPGAMRETGERGRERGEGGDRSQLIFNKWSQLNDGVLASASGRSRGATPTTEIQSIGGFG